MRGVKGGFANFVFRTVFTALRAFLKSGFCAAQLCIRSGIVSWMPFDSSLSNVPSCSCSLIRRPPCLTLCWIWRGFLVLVPGRWTACWTSNPKARVLVSKGYAIGWGWGSWIQGGGGLVGRFSTTSSSRRQCWWWVALFDTALFKKMNILFEWIFWILEKWIFCLNEYSGFL